MVRTPSNTGPGPELSSIVGAVTNPFDLTGRTALVTGSTRGIGLALVRGLSDAGARVIVNGRDPDALAQAGHALLAEGRNVLTAAFDVTDQHSVADAFAGFDEAGIEVEILVNNAGIQVRGPLLDFDLGDWQRVIDTNLTSCFVVAREAARRMAPRGHGKIVNIGSLTSQAARANVAPYSAAKGGLRLLTCAMSAEWAKYGIQANGIGPGYILTDMNTALIEDEAFNAWVISSTPAARWGRPDELAGAAVFLSSDASTFVNGHMLYVDGGWLSTL